MVREAGILKSLIIIFSGLEFSYYFTDINSDKLFYSVLCPLGMLISIFSFLIWVSLLGGNSSGDSGSGFSSSSNDCGDDGGCGD